MSKLNIDDIARLAYVSRSVVSRVLNQRPNVSDEARERVLAVIEKYNYRPSAIARSLATDRTYEISILAPRKKDEVFANAFWPLIFLGISEECIRHGYFVSLSMISDEMEAHLHDRIVHGHNFDGYVLISKKVADQVVPVLRKRDLPTVLIGHHPAFPDLDSVEGDNVTGAYRVTEYLIGLGHRRIAAIMGPPDAQESIDRLAGYHQALRAAGLPLDDALVVEGDYSQRSGYEQVPSLLDHAPRPTAIVCINDAMAAGALLALHQAGLAVPRDVSIVGYDDLPNSRFTIPPLTTVRQPIYEMGRHAAAVVIDQIEGRRKEPAHAKLDVELIVRESCSTIEGRLSNE